MLVYSVDHRQSLEAISVLLAKILRIKVLVFPTSLLTSSTTLSYSGLYSLSRVKDLPAVPMVLVGNKSDLPDSQREVTYAEGKEVATKIGCPFFESSAKVCSLGIPSPVYHAC